MNTMLMSVSERQRIGLHSSARGPARRRPEHPRPALSAGSLDLEGFFLLLFAVRRSGARPHLRDRDRRPLVFAGSSAAGALAGHGPRALPPVEAQAADGVLGPAPVLGLAASAGAAFALSLGTAPPCGRATTATCCPCSSPARLLHGLDRLALR